MGYRLKIMRYRLKNFFEKMGCRNLSRIIERDYTNHFSRYPFLVDRMHEIRSELKHPRAHYIWGVLSAADLAKHLDIPSISVIEFGVASGKGLKALEDISEKVEKVFDMSIDVYGFDTGEGLPKPKDHRDLPNLWSEGYFAMKNDELIQSLSRAKLYLGLVKDTLEDFLASKPAPIGFIIFDLDLYSSTKDAFELFKFDNRFFLPRVHCYFDDIIGWTYGDHNGELLAISEFNNEHTNKKISKIYGLRYLINVYDSYWPEQIYLAHIFEHALYAENDGLHQTDRL